MLLTMMTGWVVGAPEPLEVSTDVGRVVFSCLIEQPDVAFTRCAAAARR